MELYKVLIVSFLISAKCAGEENHIAKRSRKSWEELDEYKPGQCGKDCPGMWTKEELSKPTKKKITKEKCEEERELLKCLKKDTTCQKVHWGYQKKRVNSTAFRAVCKGVKVSAINFVILFLLIFLGVLVANVL